MTLKDQSKGNPKKVSHTKAITAAQLKKWSAEKKNGFLAAIDNYGTIALINDFGTSVYGKMDYSGVQEGLNILNEATERGDLWVLERMLGEQAVSLNAIFTAMARGAHRAEMIPQFDAYMRTALKAQNQCRATIDTLAQIKNPRHTVITKQANISNGPQQVNNTLNKSKEPEQKIQEISETSQNKLLAYDQENPYMDGRATGAASGDNSPMAAMETIHRAAH